MFGYVKTDYPNMYVKDTILYRSMYCGLCKSIGKECGQRARFALNYDLTFLSVLLHNVTGVDVVIKIKHCITHWFSKRPISNVDDLSKKIANFNIILAYYKLNDDVLDNGKGRIKRSFLKKAYKKARKNIPELDSVVKKHFNILLEYEKTNGSSIDISADPFGNMMRDSVKVIVGDLVSEELLTLCYFMGKWIYLIDALDDFDKDKKKGNFNVFVNMYPEISNKATFVKEKNDELRFVFGNVLSMIAENAKKLGYKFNHDLLDNILYLGLKNQTNNIMENRKCKKTSKF